MKVLLLLAIVFSILKILEVPKEVSILSRKAQNLCAEFAPVPSPEEITLKALVCGKSLSDGSQSRDLRSTGLIHVFVVSGGHLLVVAEILAALGASSATVALGILGFTFLTGFQAPCVRSLLGLAVHHYFLQTGQKLKSEQMVLVAGLLSLLIFPDGAQSVSLQLSWVAVLGLSLAPVFFNEGTRPLEKLFIRSAVVYTMVLPFIWQIHPLSIVWNLTLGTFTAVFLFPLCFLAFLNPLFLKLLEILMVPFWQLLSAQKMFFTPASKISLDAVTGWAWIFILHAVLHIGLPLYRREVTT